MNDLFLTSSFKKYTDVKHQPHLDDVELGMASEEGVVNLDSFFQEVENVKDDLKELEKLHRKLQDSNEETRNAHSAKTVKDLRGRMDQEVEQVLRRAKEVKAKLEALEKSNAASRKVPGCGPGTSTDRTRTSVVTGLGKKLKDLMDDFQNLRAKISSEYKETVGRRYYTVTGQQADEQTIDQLISTGESETFLMDLHQVFLDMAALVEAQGHQLNDIESHVAHANSFVRRGTDQLEVAKEFQQSSRKWTCIAIVLGAVIVVILLLPILIRL